MNLPQTDLTDPNVGSCDERGVRRMTWIVPDHEELVWKAWDDSTFWIVFHPRSRQTHLLDEISAFVLRSLTAEATTVHSLADSLVAEFELEKNAQSDAIRYVEKVISRFCEVGLAERPGT